MFFFFPNKYNINSRRGMFCCVNFCSGLAQKGLVRQFLPVLHLNGAILMYRRTLASAIEQDIKSWPLLNSEWNAGMVSILSKSRSRISVGALVNGLFVDAVALFDAENCAVEIHSSLLEQAVSRGLRPVAIWSFSSSAVLVGQQGKFRGWLELELRALKHIGWNVVTVRIMILRVSL